MREATPPSAFGLLRPLKRDDRVPLREPDLCFC